MIGNDVLLVSAIYSHK